LVRPELPGVRSEEPWHLAGNAFAAYGERVAADSPFGVTALRIPALPRATAMLRLAPQLIAAGHTVAAQDALPSYIRDKVAKTTAERMAEKAAAGGHKA
jgi:tRNA threonylcarbamoyladenosine biosynthesis protein TsaB